MPAFRSLSDFLDHLERRGDLKRVSREVDWACEDAGPGWREAELE